MAEETQTKTQTKQQKASSSVYDIIIVGSGIAGMTAALYAARAERKVLVIESQIPGGRITTTDLVENWPTHLVISGMKIGDVLTEQVKKFGVVSEWGFVKTIKKLDQQFIVKLEDEKIFQAKTVIIATGVKPKKLGVPGEKEFRGRGVSYCATCDGAFYKNKDVVVVGGGDSAVKEALFLTKFAKTVTIVHRRDQLRAEKIIARQAVAHPKILVLWNSVVEEIVGEGKIITGVMIKNISSGEQKRIACDGVFLYVGNQPDTESIQGLVTLTEDGYIAAGEDTKTNIPGLFAAGDVRVKHLRQLVTAAADGAVAAVMADEYISLHC